MKKMTIKELKEHLQNIIENLDQFEEEEEIKIVENTYWLKRGQNFIAIENVGFVDLDNPIELEDCEWCGDTYSKAELIETHEFGCLCEQCFKYLETKGEKLTRK